MSKSDKLSRKERLAMAAFFAVNLFFSIIAAVYFIFHSEEELSAASICIVIFMTFAFAMLYLGLARLINGMETKNKVCMLVLCGIMIFKVLYKNFDLPLLNCGVVELSISVICAVLANVDFHSDSESTSDQEDVESEDAESEYDDLSTATAGEQNNSYESYEEHASEDCGKVHTAEEKKYDEQLENYSRNKKQNKDKAWSGRNKKDELFGV